MIDYDKKAGKRQRIDDFWDGLYDKLPTIAWIQLPIPVILFVISMVIRCNYDGSGKGWFIASIISLIYVAFFFTITNTDNGVDETGCLPLGSAIGFISGFFIIFWLTEPGLEPKVTSNSQLGRNKYELHDNRVFCHPCDSLHTYVCVSENSEKIKRRIYVITANKCINIISVY